MMSSIVLLFDARVSGFTRWSARPSSGLNRLVVMTALVAILLALGGCSSVEKVKDQINDRIGRGEPKIETELALAAQPAPVVKSKKEMRLTRIQESLDQLGYAPGRTDGKMDSQTEAAIQDFQLDNDLRINGRPSARLLEAIDRKVQAD